MKLKVLSIVMIASMLACVLMVGMVSPGAAEFELTAPTYFYMKLSPNGGTYYNATGVWTPGQKFNLTIGIAKVQYMTAYGITFVWNSDYVAATGRYWLSSKFSGEALAGNWSSKSLGYITNDLATKVPPAPTTVGAFVDLGQTAEGAQYNVTGTFDIVTVEFQIVGYSNQYGTAGFYLWKDPSYYGTSAPYSGWIAIGTYLLDEYAFRALYGTPYWIASSGWLNPSGTPQPYNVTWCSNPLFSPPYSMAPGNAVVWISPPAPYAPLATEAVSPAYPIAGQTVTVTVTQTRAGFNGTNLNPISTITINYGDGSPTNTTAFTSPIVFYHKYSAAGTYTITEDCYAPYQPAGLAWCNITSSVTVTAPVSTGIDVYEVRESLWPGDLNWTTSGVGPGVPGRPYSPQALVHLEAYVIYNGAPVQEQIVTFEVHVLNPSPLIGPANMTILIVTAMTNATGYADIQFRIPNLCAEFGGPQGLMGKWWVYVDVAMCQIKYSDYMFFDMGYILTLSNMVPITNLVKVCQYINFTVSVTNIDWASAGNVPAYVVLVIYDNNEVPIGYDMVKMSFPGETTFCQPVTTTIQMALHIPKYAFVGQSTGYINLFTYIPSLCGLPYCPEATTSFLTQAG